MTTAQEYAERARALRELARSDDYRTELHITLAPVLMFGTRNDFKWGVRIELPRKTASGRKGKPEHVLTLLAVTAADVLRDLATMLDVDGPEISDPAAERSS